MYLFGTTKHNSNHYPTDVSSVPQVNRAFKGLHPFNSISIRPLAFNTEVGYLWAFGRWLANSTTFCWSKYVFKINETITDLLAPYILAYLSTSSIISEGIYKLTLNFSNFLSHSFKINTSHSILITF